MYLVYCCVLQCLILTTLLLLLLKVFILRETEIPHPLVHSSSVRSGQIWVDSRLGTRNPIQVFHLGFFLISFTLLCPAFCMKRNLHTKS